MQTEEKEKKESFYSWATN